MEKRFPGSLISYQNTVLTQQSIAKTSLLKEFFFYIVFIIYFTTSLMF